MRKDMKIVFNDSSYLEIKDGHILTVDAQNIGTLYLGENGHYFLVQISDIIVISDGVYSREWKHARRH